MKVDMDKLNRLMADDDVQKARPRPGVRKRLLGKAACFVMCLSVLGGWTVYQSWQNSDPASADALPKTSEANPSFTVQHMGDVSKIALQEENSTITVLGHTSARYVGLDEDGSFKTVTERMQLYDDYAASWQDVRTLAEMSFLDGTDGSHAEGYMLTEVWVGQNKNSANQSDFLVAVIPQTDNGADLSCVTFTNNPEHPNLSKAEGGYYISDGDGRYTICLQSGDVVRLMFAMTEGQSYGNVNVFDYDVSDGGYYLGDELSRKGEQKPTSGQGSEKKTVYADAIESGIHSSVNYTGEGVRLAFGSTSIGTALGDESLDGGLDTVNTWNYARQEVSFGSGVTSGLMTGVDSEGNPVWMDALSVPMLFGPGEAVGKTAYLDGECTFTFEQEGFSKTLTSVEQAWGDGLSGLDKLTELDGSFTNSFWLLDGSPSCGMDGHDILWGSGSDKTRFYRSGEQATGMFQASDDGMDHDSFFGFSYTEDFTLSPGYSGPLEFFTYSDDDLWAFVGQLDENGNLISDTVVSVADLGGVHGAAAWYCDMWSVLDKVSYNDEAQNWRLYVFWLERDGSSASCFLQTALPAAGMRDNRTSVPLVVEAGCFGTGSGESRTFMFNDGTHDKYSGLCSDGTEMTITSGMEFTLPSGLFVSITGLEPGMMFSVSETGKAASWASTGDGYKKTDKVDGVVEGNEWISFLSADGPGTLSVRAEADDGPESGYKIRLTLKDAGNMEISAMDAGCNPVGSRFMDENGQLDLTLAAGEMLTLYNLPADAQFWLEPIAVDGWHVSEVVLDGAEAEGTVSSGSVPAFVSYRYERNTEEPLLVDIEQSISSDWSTGDVILGTGSMISYKITVTNPNSIAVDATVEDVLPEDLVLDASSLLNGMADGQIITWDVTLEAGASAELSFTCRVEAEGPCEFTNTAWAIRSEDDMSSSITIKAIVQ